MDFIFMLTRDDQTVEDASEVVDTVLDAGVRHVGFKDIGVGFDTMQSLTRRIRARGGISYLEVVSTTPGAVVRSLQAAQALDVDRVLGGTDGESARRVLGDLSRYFPFPGNPVGHPTKLKGSAELIADQSRGWRAQGCGGVDLLAYRAVEADPIDLVRAARRGLGTGLLIVAGSVNSRERIHAIAAAGADAFTIGSAAFDGSFSPRKGSLQAQIAAILDACQNAPSLAA